MLGDILVLSQDWSQRLMRFLELCFLYLSKSPMQGKEPNQSAVPLLIYLCQTRGLLLFHTG